jgi:hypothetical protein
MKTSNHHIYYATGLSWDFAERLFQFGCRKYPGHNCRHTSRYPKRKDWNKSARQAIKSGKVDGINLKNYAD